MDCSFFKGRDRLDIAFLFVISFLVVGIGRSLLFLIANRSKKKKLSIEMKYLVSRFKISKRILEKKSFMFIISLLDATIISSTVLVTSLITDNLILELFISLIFVLLLIAIVYEVLGRILIKKGYGKNGI